LILVEVGLRGLSACLQVLVCEWLVMLIFGWNEGQLLFAVSFACLMTCPSLSFRYHPSAQLCALGIVHQLFDLIDYQVVSDAYRGIAALLASMCCT